MFLGTHTPRLDDKGRLILPAKFRDELAEGLVITKGQERCLYVCPIAEFERFAAMQPRRRRPRKVRDYMRVFRRRHDEIPDKQGRITLPQPLRSTPDSTGTAPSSARHPRRGLGHRGVGQPTSTERARPAFAGSVDPRRCSPASSEPDPAALRRAADPPR